MIPTIARALVLCVLACVGAGAAIADERADAALQRKLAEFNGADRGQVVPVSDSAVTAVLPQYHVYVLRFRQYPVSIEPPAPLQTNNLFVVNPDDSVEYLRTVDDLQRFFRTALAPVTTSEEAKAATRAWLQLVEELHQDGFFRFSIPEDSLHVTAEPGGALRTSGRAMVTPHGGNAGDITASLAFDASGRLASASETANLKRGMRPICQATKLLDADPIVRRMAEQDLLVMGESARDYLEEQRGTAGPDLRAAIDRIWQRIVREGR